MSVTRVPAFGRYRIEALGTTAEVLVTDPGLSGASAALLDDGIDWIDRLASRFRPDSELSRLNRAGCLFGASPDLVEVLQAACRAARLSDGLVTPMVGRALCAIGYDRDFAGISTPAHGTTTGAGRALASAPVPDWRAIRIDPASRTVVVPEGAQIDLGSIGKAWAADRIAPMIAAQLDCGVLVSLGGDVSAAGPAPEDGWTIGIADRCIDEPDDARAVVSISSGGLATSGTSTRTWYRNGTLVHHLIDPTTGLPAPSCWRSVSVAAATCTDANTAATASMVMGTDAPAWLEALGMHALLVTTDGSPLPVGNWPVPTRS